MKRIFDAFRGKDVLNEDPEALLARAETLKGSELTLAAKRLVSEGLIDQLLEKVVLPEAAQKEVVKSLVNTRQGEVLINHLEHFSQVPRYELGYRLIEVGRADFVFGHLDQFSDMPVGDAIELAMKGGQVESVLTHIDAIAGYEDWITSTLVKMGDFETLFAQSELMKTVGQTEVALSFVYHRKVDALFTHWDAFSDVDQGELVSRLINSGSVWAVGRYLPKMDQLDPKEVAQEMIEAGRAEYVARDLPVFEGVDHAALASQLMAQGEMDVLGAHLKHFRDLPVEVLRDLIADPHHVMEVAESFDAFDPEIVTETFYQELLDTHAASVIALNMDKFQMADVSVVADGFLGSDTSALDMQANLDRIPAVLQEEIVRQVLRDNYAHMFEAFVAELSVPDKMKQRVQEQIRAYNEG